MQKPRLPFTYVLDCPNGKRYYGVRYAIGCNPEDLWNTYFTSSKTVKALINQYGIDGFKCEIRKVFDSVDNARIWEHKVLRRLRVTTNDNWINKTDNISFPDQTGVFHKKRKKCTVETGRKISAALKGKKHSEEHNRNNAEAQRGKKHTAEHNAKIKAGCQSFTRSPEHRKKIGDALRGKPKSVEHKANLRAHKRTAEHAANLSKSMLARRKRHID